MAADGKHYNFSVKETYFYPMTTDSSASTTGPVYGTGVQIIGIQTLSFTLNSTAEQLPGDDVILGVENSDDALEISCTYAKQHHAGLAAMKGGVTEIAAGVSTYYHTPAETTIYGKLVCRCHKIGKSGADTVITVYKMNVSSIEFGVENKAFRTRSLSGQAIFTDSTFDVSGNQKSLMFKEEERETSAAIVTSPDTTAPTVSSTAPTDAATGVAVSTTIVWTFSEDLDVNYVHADNVFLMTDAGVPVACGAPVLVNGGASTTVTLTPSSDLSGSTDYIAVLQNVRDLAGNVLAARSVVNFQTT